MHFHLPDTSLGPGTWQSSSAVTAGRVWDEEICVYIWAHNRSWPWDRHLTGDCVCPAHLRQVLQVQMRKHTRCLKGPKHHPSAKRVHNETARPGGWPALSLEACTNLFPLTKEWHLLPLSETDQTAGTTPPGNKGIVHTTQLLFEESVVLESRLSFLESASEPWEGPRLPSLQPPHCKLVLMAWEDLSLPCTVVLTRPREPGNDARCHMEVCISYRIPEPTVGSSSIPEYLCRQLKCALP